MCGFDAECVAIVANVRFFLRFFLIIATIVTHLRQNHTPFFTVQLQQLRMENYQKIKQGEPYVNRNPLQLCIMHDIIIAALLEHKTPKTKKQCCYNYIYSLVL